MKEQKLISKHHFFLKCVTSSNDEVIFLKIIYSIKYKKYIFKPCLLLITTYHL